MKEPGPEGIPLPFLSAPKLSELVGQPGAILDPGISMHKGHGLLCVQGQASGFACSNERMIPCRCLLLIKLQAAPVPL